MKKRSSTTKLKTSIISLRRKIEVTPKNPKQVLPTKARRRSFIYVICILATEENHQNGLNIN